MPLRKALEEPEKQIILAALEANAWNRQQTADVLQTTIGAVKSALHRARGRLREPAAAPSRRAASAELVDRFVERFNASDLPGLTKLLLDDASVEQLGCAYSSGRDALEEGFLHKAVYGHPEWPAELQYDSSRLEHATFAGEPIALGLVVRRGREALEQVMRFEEQEGHVARIRTYAFCPEAMREIGEALGLRVRTGLYRYPTPAPGRSY